MKHIFQKDWVNKRLGFFCLMTFLFWAKTIFAYLIDFNLGIENIFQYLILFINPIATTVFLFSISLFVKKPKPAYITLFVIYILSTLLLFSNVIYYREFSDFITINTMLSSAKVSSGLGESALRLFRPYDIIYWIDVIVLIGLFATKKIKIDQKIIKARHALAVTCAAALMFALNLSLAESNRPQLLSRTFSHDYIVKYLGLNVFTAYDGVLTYRTNQVRAQASANDLTDVEDYVNQHYAAPTDDKFGIAKGRNVIYVHLESFQQFLINYKLKDENGVEHEVTPFLNSIYDNQSTYSFENFFHQVKAGKTSDAETLFENSLFGLDQGPLFTQLGGQNTFQAAPAILNQEAGYTSAVFHGNSGNFWNRNETYKHFGFDYFFDSSYYDLNENNSFQYGLHDKPFLQSSVKYLEQLQQPFYTKFLTVSNHYPYSEFTNEDETGFPRANTKDATINGYFATANYLDKAVEEFFNYLKASGLYDNSIIVLYGDHYGISNTRNPDLAELLGKSKEDWDTFDNMAIQRVPYMIHVPGRTDGKIYDTYGGQVDALPTLLHLLGINTDKYLQLGTDLFSSKHDQVVAFRDHNFVSPKYYVNGKTIFDAKTGEQIEEPTEQVLNEVKQMQDGVDRQLATSDAITNGDLLRYYDKSGLTPVDPSKYSYKKQMNQLKKVEKAKGDKSTSLYDKDNQKSTEDLYQTKSYKDYEKEVIHSESTASNPSTSE